jgi:hypothetical protein
VYDSERTLYLSHNNTLSLDDALSTVVSKTRESSRLRVSERTLSKSQSLVTAVAPVASGRSQKSKWKRRYNLGIDSLWISCL